MKSVSKLLVCCAALFGLAAVAPACVVEVNDNPTASVDRYCDRLVACGVLDTSGFSYTYASCQDAYGTLVLPAGCVGAVESASCSELNASSASAYSVCFPPCSVTTCSLDGDRLELCQNGTFIEFTYDCDAVCRSTNQVYSGVCGTSFDGQVSASGDPVCWCE